MGEVIGYKGTADERLEAWATMLFLKKSVDWSKRTDPEVFKSSIAKEQQFLADERSAYCQTPRVQYELRRA
jgi:hypothetical protein